MHTGSHVVLVRVSRERFVTVERAFPRQPLCVCRSDVEFLTGLEAFRGGSVVWEITGMMPASPEIERKVREAALNTRIVILASLRTPHAARIAVALVCAGVDLSVVLVDDLELLSSRAECLGRKATSLPDHHIIRRLAPLVPAELVTPLVAAISTGGRKTSVPALADLCGMSVRKLESGLAASGVPAPHSLLAWSTAFHSMWHVEFSGQPLKQAASDAGFRSISAFGNHLHRNVGQRPSAILKSGGFWSLLDQFAGLFRPGTGLQQTVNTAMDGPPVFRRVEPAYTEHAWRPPTTLRGM